MIRNIGVQDYRKRLDLAKKTFVRLKSVRRADMFAGMKLVVHTRKL